MVAPTEDLELLRAVALRGDAETAPEQRREVGRVREAARDRDLRNRARVEHEAARGYTELTVNSVWKSDEISDEKVLARFYPGAATEPARTFDLTPGKPLCGSDE